MTNVQLLVMLTGRTWQTFLGLRVGSKRIWRTRSAAYFGGGYSKTGCKGLSSIHSNSSLQECNYKHNLACAHGQILKHEQMLLPHMHNLHTHTPCTHAQRTHTYTLHTYIIVANACTYKLKQEETLSSRNHLLLLKYKAYYRTPRILLTCLWEVMNTKTIIA